MSGIPYYWISKAGRAYWRPNKRMNALGFAEIPLGPAGPEAEERARVWYARWQAFRVTPEAKSFPPISRSKTKTRRRARGVSYVYFLQVDHRIKIGTSDKPLSRLQDLAGGAHGRYSRIVVVPGTPADERRLHKRFASYRTNGEWFDVSGEILLSLSRCAIAGRVVHDGDEQRTFRVPGVGFSTVPEVSESDETGMEVIK